MSSRHRAREAALQILYRYDVDGQGKELSLPPSAQLAAELVGHFDHFQIHPPLREFAAELVAGTLMERNSLDESIEKSAANWRISRMSYIDRNLLRMGLYELKHFPETSAAVVIDEAIELAKQFGTAESAGFINGILDTMKRDLRDGGSDR